MKWTIEKFLQLTAEQIANMTAEELKKVLDDVKEALQGDEAVQDLGAVQKKVNDVQEERSKKVAGMERRNLINAIANGNLGVELRSFDADNLERMNKNQKSDDPFGTPEYRRAFIKNLAGEEMTDIEKRAFTHTTTMANAPVPTQMLNEIWDLVSNEHAIMGDVRVLRTGTVIEIMKHVSIKSGKAKKVAEGAANVDEENEFVKVTLSGNDFSKHIKISYAMGTMSIPAFDQYLQTEIAGQIGEALADDVIATIINQMHADNKVTAAGAEFTYKDVVKVFGMLKRAKNKVVYTNDATLYGQLASMVDTTGRPIFQPSMQEGIAGVLFGAKIKIEDSLADGQLLVGDPQRVTYNMVQDILIEKDKDIANHLHIYAGYARGQGALIDDKAMALLTAGTQAGG